MGTKFENVYLRCSLNSDGNVPDNGDSSSSPDIFSNGADALADFQNVLTTAESYSKQPKDKSVTGVDNYCYLRCKNNSNKAISAKAQLFYVQSSVILWPSCWVDNPMYVDLSGETVNTIPEIQPGAIGVVERPFIWKTPTPNATNNHYCLIGRLFTEDTPNPIPDVGHPISMATIIQTNLMFAKRNISIINTDSAGNAYCRVMLNAPASLMKPAKFHLFMYVDGAKGWDVETKCSETDMNGRTIGLSKRTIENNDDIYMGQCVLEPGFAAILTTYINTNGTDPTKGSISISAEYAANQDDLNYMMSLYSNKKTSAEGVVIPQLKTDKLKEIASHNKEALFNDTVGTIEFGRHTVQFI
jgi:hypothetical protein